MVCPNILTIIRDCYWYWVPWGIIAALAAPGLPFFDNIPRWWILWVALAPLLAWIHQKPKEAATSALYGGTLFGIGYHALYESWFLDLHPLTWMGFTEWQSLTITLAALTLTSVYGGALMGLMFMAYHQLYHKIPGPLWVRYSLLLGIWPALWVYFFQFMGSEPIFVPWALLEYTQMDVTLLRHTLIPWTGMASSVTALMLAHNMGGAWLLSIGWPQLKGQKILTQWIGRGTLIATLGVAPLLLGMANNAYHPSLKAIHAPQVGYEQPIMVVQGNFDIDTIRNGGLTALSIGQRYHAPLLHGNLPPNTLVVLPEEGAVRGWVSLYSPALNPDMSELLRIAEDRQINILVGVTANDPIRQDKTYNAMAYLAANGTIKFYMKRQLVPFGETTPYLSSELVQTLLNPLGVDYGKGFSPGQDRPELLRSTDQPLNIGGLVCFELINSGFAQSYKASGANLLVNSSNLGWFHGNTQMEKQFLAIGQARAAETKIPMVIAANTGISAILDHTGTIIRQSPSGRYAKLFVPDLVLMKTKSAPPPRPLDLYW